MQNKKSYPISFTLSCYNNQSSFTISHLYKTFNSPAKEIQFSCKNSFSLFTSNFKTERDLICVDEGNSNNIYILLIYYQKITKDLLLDNLKKLIFEIKKIKKGKETFFILPIELIGIHLKPKITVDLKMHYDEIEYTTGKNYYKILNNYININELNKHNFLKV